MTEMLTIPMQDFLLLSDNRSPQWIGKFSSIFFLLFIKTLHSQEKWKLWPLYTVFFLMIILSNIMKLFKHKAKLEEFYSEHPFMPFIYILYYQVVYPSLYFTEFLNSHLSLKNF